MGHLTELLCSSAIFVLATPAVAQIAPGGAGLGANMGAAPFGATAVAAGITVSATAPPAAAATQPTSNGAIGDIVVTARKVSESVQRVPLAITALGAAQLQNLQIQNYSDLSRTTPSLYVTRYNSNPASPLISIRGVAQQDVTLNLDSPVGVYVDGVYYPHSFGLDASMIDVARVEVLKGSQGTLFGKNTTGGAISVTTRDPYLDTVGGYLNGQVGNYDAVGLEGGVNLPLVDGKVGLRVVGSASSHGGYGHDLDGRPLNDNRSQFIRGKLLWQPSAGLHVKLSGDYQKLSDDGSATHLTGVNNLPSTARTPTTDLVEVATELGLAPTAANLVTARNTLLSYMYGAANGPSGFYDSTLKAPTTGFFAGRPQRGYFSGGGVGLDIAYELSQAISARSITSFRAFKRDDVNEIDSTPFDLVYADSYSRSHYYGQELQLLGKVARFNWILGAYGNIENAFEGSDSTAVPKINPNNPSQTIANLRNTSEAIFGQATYELTNRLRLTGGLRYTWETKKNVSGNNVTLAHTCTIPTVLLDMPGVCQGTFKNSYSDYSYLASIDYTLMQGALVYAKTSRGFKGGGENIRGSGTIGSFAPFAPETVTDYELGFKSDLLDRRLRVNGALYYSNYNNIQRSARVLSAQGQVVSLITNAAKGRIKGAELEVTAKPVPQVTLGFNGSITDAKYLSFFDAALGDRTNEPFAVPKYSYALTALYEIPTANGKVSLSADWAWRSNVVFAPAAIFKDQVSQSAYGLLNARLAYKLDGPDLEIAAFVKNALAKEYYVAGGAFDNSLGYNIEFVGTPRTFGLQVIKRFGGG